MTAPTPEAKIAALTNDGDPSHSADDTDDASRATSESDNTDTMVANKDLINTMLPEELILKIFSFLDILSLCRCATVCKYWNKLALDPDNWQNISLFVYRNRFFGDRCPDEIIQNLANRYGDHLKRVNLRGCNITDESIKVLSSNCRQLEDISLDDCHRLTDEACLQMAKNCSKLTSLNLASCNITDRSLEAIGQGCQDLKLIDISNCNSIRPAGIASLARDCQDLVSFISKACSRDTINDESLHILGTWCHKLKLVNLNGCSAITDVGIGNLAQGCTQLVSLCLSRCHEITDQSLIHLAGSCHQLRFLGLNDCINLTDSGFYVLTQNCKLLENLDLEDCSQITDQTLLYLTNNCSNLKRLALSHCDKITDEGIKYIGNSETYCLSLQYLELDNCTQLTDTSMDHLTYCKHLKRLDIYDNNRITHQAIKKLFTFLPQIEIRSYNQSTSSQEQAVTEARNRYYRCCSVI